MPSKAIKRWRHKNKQVAVYTPPLLLEKLKAEAVRRRRALGPCVLDILHEYFAVQERGGPKFETLSHVRS